MFTEYVFVLTVCAFCRERCVWRLQITKYYQKSLGI